MGDYNFDLTPLIYLGATVGVVIVLVIWGLVAIFTSSDIKTDKPIKPKIELIIKDNKVDTLYIYEKP